MNPARIFALSWQVIIVRCGPEVADADILASFGLDALPPAEGHPEICIARGRGWAHVLDYRTYTLHNSGLVADGVSTLAEHYEVFAFWVGDADHAYELEWYRGGRRVRHRLFDPVTGERIDEGEPADFEPELPWPDGEDPFNAMWAYVRRAGVELDVHSLTVRWYAFSRK